MKFIHTILAILFAFGAFPKQPVLRFKNHKIKIVQFTDLHLNSGKEFAERNDSTYRLMRTVINEETPDLVVLTGDIVVSGGAAQIWYEAVQPLTEAKVLFAVTFGNHEILERGARVMELHENEKKFDTQILTLSAACLDYSFLHK